MMEERRSGADLSFKLGVLPGNAGLSLSMTPKQWARKHLRRGDLSVLSRISKREWPDADPDQIDRLTQRSFIKKKADNSFRPTAKGRAALWIRRLSGLQGWL